jgi:3-phenylpropionate/trans-cinnamate dioxygenase ferredoxin reductase subunit
MHGAIVIIGSGQAGAQTAITLRDLGHKDPIVLFGDEPHPPYQRPPLSKAFLKGEFAPERLYLRPLSFYADRGIEFISGRRAVALDPGNRTISFADGGEISYAKAVIATGTRARVPEIPGMNRRGVFTLRSLSDAEALTHAITTRSRLVILGGGYIGLEVASSVRMMHAEAIVIEAEDRVLKRVTSEPIAEFMQKLHIERGTTIVTSAKAIAIERDGEGSIVRLDGGETIAADAVLVATGAIPNAELAASAGIITDQGILVDEYGRTSAPDVYACGDCARFPSRRYGGLIRLESVQNAIDQAKAVAQAMMGDPKPYDPVPWFWSDQFETKLQIAGLSAPGDSIAVAGDRHKGPFAVEYRREGRLVALDAVNNARAHMLARRRIEDETSPPVFTPIA